MRLIAILFGTAAFASGQPEASLAPGLTASPGLTPIPTPTPFVVTTGEASQLDLASKVRLVESRGCKRQREQIREPQWFSDLIQNSPEFRMENKRRNVKVVFRTSAELGLKEAGGPGEPIPNFKEQIEKNGYRLCSHEVAALILTKVKGPILPTYIATETISGKGQKGEPIQLVPVIFSDEDGNVCPVARKLDLYPAAPRQFFVVEP